MRFAHLRNLFLIVFNLGFATPVLADLEAALAAADPAAGEREIRSCVSCHTVEQGGANRVGPNLYGIVGGPVAAVESFRYSQAMTDFGGEWTVERLNAFLTRPRDEVRGTSMGFGGLRDLEDRANIIAYLNTLSDEPLTLAQSATGETIVDDTADDDEFGVLVNAPGVEATYYSCIACHSERIVAQQGLTRYEWDDILEWMVEEQGMYEIEEPDRTEILDYLAEHYNVDRPNFPDPLN